MNSSVLKTIFLGSWLAICGASSAATTYFSNLGQASDGIGWAQFGNIPDYNASDFLTGASAVTITSATFPLSNWDAVAHVLTPMIYTNSGGTPGTLVGSFSDITINADPGGPGAGTYSNYSATAAGINLAANTTYWMVLKNGTAPDLPFPVLWNTTASNTMDGGSTFSEVAATKLKYSTDAASWADATANTANAMFSLSGNLAAAPEPSRVLLLFAGAAGFLLRRRRI